MQANPQIYQKYKENIQDNRVHLILYFFSSPRIQEIDIDVLKKL